MSKTLDAIRGALSGKMPGANQQKGDLKFYNFPKGTEEVGIRLLPHWGGDSFPLKLKITHFNIPDSKPITCPKTFGADEHCDICDVLAEYEGQGDFLWQYSGSIGAQGNGLIIKDPTQRINAKLPHIISFGVGLVKQLSDLWEDPEAAMLCDLYEGRTIFIKREKQGGKFSMRTAFTGTPIVDSEEEANALLQSLPNLDKIVKPLSDDDLNNIREAALKLKDVIENRLVSETPSNAGVPNQEDEGNEPPSMPKETKPAAGKPATSKPSTTKPATTQKPAASKPATGKPAAGKSATSSKPAAAAPKAAASDKPEDAPECYGNSTAYDANSDKCVECPYEFQCSEEIKKQG